MIYWVYLFLRVLPKTLKVRVIFLSFGCSDNPFSVTGGQFFIFNDRDVSDYKQDAIAWIMKKQVKGDRVTARVNESHSNKDGVSSLFARTPEVTAVPPFYCWVHIFL